MNWSKAKLIVANKIKAAKKPEDLFPLKASVNLAEEVKEAFKAMALLVHPDTNQEIKEAVSVAATLNALHDQAQNKIAKGLWGRSAITITFDKNKIVTDVEVYQKGDICDIYKGMFDGKTVIIKTSNDAADLIKSEATVLRKLYSSEDLSKFKKHLPNLIDSIKINGKLANIFEFDSDSYTLEEVIEKHPNGLEGRTVAWMWKRMLEAVSWAHSLKHVHGCIVPSNILIQPPTHGLILLDWCYAVPMGGTAKAYVETYKDFFPPELFKKLPLDGGADLYMIAKCVQQLFNGKNIGRWPSDAPKLMTGLAESCLIANNRNRSIDTWEVYGTLNKNLEKIYGKPKFIPFTI